MKKIKIISLILVLVIGTIVLTGCTESNRVSSNIRKQADNFNVTRRISVINARSDKPVFELIGNFSLQNNANNELEIIVEEDNWNTKKYIESEIEQDMIRESKILNKRIRGLIK